MSLKFLLAFTPLLISCTSLSLDDPIILDWLQDQRSHLPEVKAADTYVQIANGTLKGTTYTAVGGSTIYAYLGIPYAAPPVDNLRFEPPQEYEGWGGGDNVRDANLHPPACPQWLTNTTVAMEDCLFVSVYTKRGENNTGDLLPVMYWMHGGGFLLGQTSYYTSSKLLAQDVVLVTVQYRMGPLGFMSMQDEVLPGNMGMKDMVQGLRWVNENIEAFGGDPGRVTIFGESAGAAAATFMLVSPLAQGLFHGAAAMSGTAVAEWSMDRDPIDSTMRLANILECDNSTTTTILACMRSKPWEEISQSHFTMLLSTQASQLRANLAGTSPVVEPDLPGAFISKEPLELLERGEVAQVPVVLGCTQHEGSLLLAAAYILRLGHNDTLQNETYVHDKLIGDLLATWGVDESVNGASVSQVLSSGYIPNDNPKTNFTTFTYELMDMISALFMKAPVLRTAEILSRKVPSVYLYSFEYTSRNSLWNFLALVPIVAPDLGIPIPPFDGGITHADDLMYMYSFPVIPTIADRAFSKVYCEFFTNFAIDGEPAKTATDTYPQWPKFNVSEGNYMEIVAEPNVKQHYSNSWRQGLTGR